MKILDSIFNFQKVSTKEQSVVTDMNITDAAKSQAEELNINTQLESLGVDPESELGEALKMVDQAGYPIDAEMVEEMRAFIDNADGSTEDKLETVKKVLDKKIEVSEKVLTLVHTSLHESMLPESVKNRLLEMTEGMTMKAEAKQLLMEIANQLKSDGTLSPDEMSETLTLLAEKMSELGIDLSDLNKENISLLLNALVSEGAEELDMTQNLPEQIQSEVTLVEMIGETNAESQVPNDGFGRVLEAAVEPMVESVVEPISIEDAVAFLENVEENIEKMVKFLKSDTESDDDIQYEELGGLEPTELIEDFMSILQNNSNTFIRREVTEKIAEVSNEFTEFKRSAVNMLSDVSREIEKESTMSNEEKIDQLSKVIDKLDKVILKSDITLYTDMKTEKKLLKFSSDLTEAKALLEKGQMQEAKKITDAVIKTLDEMQFKPAKIKVMHVVNKKALDQVMQFKEQTGVQILEKQIEHFESVPKSPRAVVDYMRQLGLNNDSEILEQMGINKNSKVGEYKIENNLRHILEKLNEETDNKSNVVQAGEKMMNHLTGQQLGNKLESKSQTQTLFFNIPLKMQEEIKDLKLYVQSRKQNQKMDWENSSMYFAIQTKSFDEMGIKVTSVSSNVTITVLNNHEELKKTMEPMMNEFKSSIEEVGYHVTGVYYSRLTGASQQDKMESVKETLNNNHKSKSDNEVPSYDQSKGFDLKV